VTDNHAANLLLRIEKELERRKAMAKSNNTHNHLGFQQMKALQLQTSVPHLVSAYGQNIK